MSDSIKKTKLENRKGFAAIVSVMIVGGIGVAVSVGLLLLGVSSMKTSESMENSAKARYIADACGEYALESLRKNHQYGGSEQLNFDYGTCEIKPIISVGGDQRTVQVESNVGTVKRRIQINVVVLSPVMEYDSWSEVSDF